MELTVLSGQWAVCRLPADSALPEWATRGALWSVTRTGDELSVVVEAGRVPADVTSEGPWAALKVEGPLELNAVGILAFLTYPLAEARVPVFAVSTYDTDYLLVPTPQLESADFALTAAGHTVRDVPD
jgi:uncharacterized protein